MIMILVIDADNFIFLRNNRGLLFVSKVCLVIALCWICSICLWLHSAL